MVARSIVLGGKGLTGCHQSAFSGVGLRALMIAQTLKTQADRGIRY